MSASSVVVSEFNFATVSGAIMHLVEIVVSWLHDFQSLFSLNYFFAPMTENETSFKLKSYRREDSVLKSPSSHYSIAVDYCFPLLICRVSGASIHLWFRIQSRRTEMCSDVCVSLQQMCSWSTLLGGLMRPI